MKNEHDMQAEKFLEKTGTKIIIKYSKTERYFPDDKDRRDIYKITLKKD